jgi:hypothetical protein
MNAHTENIERWDFFELRLTAKPVRTMNPFFDVSLTCAFSSTPSGTVKVNGFYDGDDTYIVRFMPETEGTYKFITSSNVPGLDAVCGQFECIKPASDNHGPVRVADSSNFAYADGRPYFPFGTTCYVWTHQGDKLEAETLKTLRTAPFNKMRMCVFPKRYRYNYNEPEFYPFEGRLIGKWEMSSRDRLDVDKILAEWDFDRFNPLFFQHLERRILELRELGIEADLILFHPYDFGAWGFDRMPRGVNERYLKYIVARLSAFRNVWWSFANEYDLMRAVTMADWDAYFRLVRAEDPYNHLRSIHNCFDFYDHSQAWVTHCSIQSSEMGKVGEWVGRYAKPVVVDECCYEGDIEMAWGDLTAEAMTERFWIGFCRGGYVGHGETYVNAEEVLWWSKGGILRGKSPDRIAFLRKIIEESGVPGLKPIRLGESSVVDGWNHSGASHYRDEYYLVYIDGSRQPTTKVLHLGSQNYRVDLIDTWNMGIDTLGVFTGEKEIHLPKKPPLALRIVRQK